MLTVSTFIQLPAGLFFAFVILNGIVQAAAGSYLQTSVISVASLFGPTALQAMMAGQAAVGVAVSAVQVVSAASSLRGEPIPGAVVVESSPEERSAFAFFALSTAFLILSAGAHAWLTRLPSYKAVVGQFSQIQHVARGDSGVMEVDPAQVAPISKPGAEKRDQIIRVAKSNLIYNLGVAYVFIATLVCEASDVTSPEAEHLLLGRVSANYTFHTTDKSFDAPALVQRRSFPSVQYRRLRWSLLHLIPSTAHLVIPATARLVPRSNPFHRYLPDVQCPARDLYDVIVCHHQL